MLENDSSSGRVFTPLGDTRTRTDLVVESIRTAILSGNLKPGETLVERTIGAELNVSKTPVREALISLTRSGLIEMTRNRGASVARISLTDMRHLYEQRLLLEPWAVRSAILVPGADFTPALEALREAETAGNQRDFAAGALANRRFHRSLYTPCKNKFVTRSLDGLQDLGALATATYLWERWPTWAEEALEHRHIYESAVNGNADKAAELVRQHIQASLDRVIDGEVGPAK